MFGWLLILAILELGFTVDTFQYLQRKHQWRSKQERQRISFLLFSSVRSVVLAAVYMGARWANRWFKSLHHTVRPPVFPSSREKLIWTPIDLPIPQHGILDRRWCTRTPNLGLCRMRRGRTPQRRTLRMPRTQSYRNPCLDHRRLLHPHHHPDRHGCHEAPEAQSREWADPASEEYMVATLGVKDILSWSTSRRK
jgi:hypothetical protein